ncbi:membrane-associated progesterone receptor component 2 [Geospiza fortis]|uniref:Membrane-associated progesterone receptor component 2 n=1 Tax=Geospiza fortis TaxID=48883 RepID=A0A6I9HSW2_GEOFO|nr:membrane-associated progesterone receptor component 2 [Geospiza fortis]
MSASTPFSDSQKWKSTFTLSTEHPPEPPPPHRPALCHPSGQRRRLTALRRQTCRSLGGCPAGQHDVAAAALPRMKRRDFSLEQLREFDGARNPRILLAVNGKVFDVTKGSKFYGPEGPYGIFAGRDASRGLATFCLDKDALRDEYDDLSDLNAVQMESVREWEMQFKEKYDYVGRLLKPGEEPSEYTDEEDTKDHTKQE